MEKIKVFISQKMADKTEAEILRQREHLSDVARLSLDGDVEIIDSYFDDYNPTGEKVGLKYLGESLKLLADADVAIFSNDWESARGCRIEHEAALSYGIDCIIESYSNDSE